MAVVALAAVFSLQGCLSYGPAPPSTGGGNSVEMKNIAFIPTNLDVKNGTTVTWYNNDTVGHTVSFDNGPFPSSGIIAPGSTYSVTFDQVGTFNYHCSIHPSMIAKIVVA
jgi:plastocyanin